MRKKLIKKGQGGLALFSNQLMGQSSMNFSQPLTDLNDPMIDKLSSPMGNIKLNKLTTPNLVMKGPDTSKIVSGLNSTLFDTEFQNRMATGQSNYMKQMKSAQNKQKWGDFKSNIKEFGSSDFGIQTLGQIVESVGNLLPNTNDDKISQGIDAGLKGAAKLGFSKEAMAATGGTSAVVGGVIYGADALNKGIGALTNGATSLENSTNLFDSVSGSMLGIVNPIMLANNLTKKKIAGTSDYASSQAQSSSYADSGRVGKAEIGGVSNLFSNIFGRDLVAERRAKVNKINRFQKKNK